MTERKPANMGFESWIDKQIREAEQRGEFDDLPGKGKPIPGIDGPDDELWWVKQLMRREGLTYLPPTLALRKEAEDVLAALPTLHSEQLVRERIGALNQKIAAAIRTPMEGPPLNLTQLDVERTVAAWRERRSGHGEHRT